MPLSEKHVALILVPKPNEAGLHPVVEVRAQYGHGVELHTLNGKLYDSKYSTERSRIADARFDSSSRQHINRDLWVRSAAFGALDMQDFPSAPLPPLTASERADDQAWASLDF